MGSKTVKVTRVTTTKMRGGKIRTTRSITTIKTSTRSKRKR